ncbi:hypothetical protein B0O99DRAFT_331865 [Bisporella sp. PMI_857]|nr:hypothetical protein B0O99DRAFT_331865 [Bisporella sp. PMI_857]
MLNHVFLIALILQTPICGETSSEPSVKTQCHHRNSPPRWNGRGGQSCWDACDQRAPCILPFNGTIGIRVQPSGTASKLVP